MKRELLIATILLAAGGMLWAGQNGGLSRAIPLVEHWLPIRFSEKDETTKPGLPAFNSPREVILPADLLQQQLPASWEVPNLSKLSSDSQAVYLLEELATNLKNSPPMAAEVAILLRWNDLKLRIEGNYSQMGRGSGQARLDLHVINSTQPLSLTKVYDGRFLYTVEQQADQKRMEFIDLRRIQQARSNLTNNDLTNSANSANSVSLGELSMLFENLALLFQFDAPNFQQIEGQKFCHLDGTWRTESIRQLFGSMIAEHHLEPEIVWHKLPPQIPHQISLTLIQTETLGWAPQRIMLVRFPKPNRKKNAATSDNHLPDPTTIAIPMALIDFSNYRTIDIDTEELLHIDSSELETIDNTELYLTQ